MIMRKLYYPFFLTFIFTSCATGIKTITYNDTGKASALLAIDEGILTTEAQRVKYRVNGRPSARIGISEPYIVIQAEDEEKWGYYQFPNVGKADDGTLVVTWQMKRDSHKTYGQAADRQYTPMMSKDAGVTWTPQDRGYDRRVRGYNVDLTNGVRIQVSTPASKDIHSYKKFPEPVSKNGNRTYYVVKDLPNEFQGVYLIRRNKQGKSSSIHAKLNDPGLLRYDIGGLMPVVWWGNIKELSDGSLLAGMYPCDYIESDGSVLNNCVSFYESKDEGDSWKRVGRIPFSKDGIADVKGEGGFTEPTFEVLADSTLICVMRSGSASPMYRSFSKDMGRTWTKPEPFTANGVKPSLILLKNGVLALASGRPGIQVRFSLDGMGMAWTDPIDMIPFMNEDGSYIQDVSCGYPSIIDADDNSFYLVYSDFTTKNKSGEVRKSIVCRKVTVKPY